MASQISVFKILPIMERSRKMPYSIMKYSATELIKNSTVQTVLRNGMESNETKDRNIIDKKNCAICIDAICKKPCNV